MTDRPEVSLIVVFTNFNGYTARTARLADAVVTGCEFHRRLVMCAQ